MLISLHTLAVEQERWAVNECPGQILSNRQSTIFQLVFAEFDGSLEPR